MDVGALVGFIVGRTVVAREVGKFVGDGEGFIVGRLVGGAVGAFVGVEVGTFVDVAVGVAVFVSVFVAVGPGVSPLVGARVGTVGAEVGAVVESANKFPCSILSEGIGVGASVGESKDEDLVRFWLSISARKSFDDESESAGASEDLLDISKEETIINATAAPIIRIQKIKQSFSSRGEPLNHCGTSLLRP